GADVTCRENSGNGGFQWAWLAVTQRPKAGLQRIDTGEDRPNLSRATVSGNQEHPGSAPMKTNTAEIDKLVNVLGLNLNRCNNPFVPRTRKPLVRNSTRLLAELLPGCGSYLFRFEPVRLRSRSP